MIESSFMQNGARVINYLQFHDNRGYFMELNKEGEMTTLIGHQISFMQENLSFSKAGVFRGMHYQFPSYQGKLVRAVGKIIDFWVNLDSSALDFGALNYRTLEESHQAIYIPPGYAHGFLAVHPSVVIYHCTTQYQKEQDYTLDYKSIDGLEEMILKKCDAHNIELCISTKDQAGITLEQTKALINCPSGGGRTTK